VKVGDIVRFQEEDMPWPDGWPGGLTGIVTKLYHEGHDALVLLSDGRLFIDRVENFVVL
jgi:hypothetical protein